MDEPESDSSMAVMSLDTRPFEQALAEVQSLMEGPADVPEEIVNRLIDILHSRIELIRIECLPAVWAGELRFGLQPSNKLLNLMATLRALKGKAGIRL